MRHLTLEEVKAKCAKHKVPCEQMFGFKYVVLVGRIGQGHVTYNSVSGHFTGYTPTGRPFNSSKYQLNGMAWMRKLRAFFTTEE